MISEPAHLDAIALRLQHGQQVISFNRARFDVKASLSNKSEQKLRSLNSRWLASYLRPLFEALYYSYVDLFAFMGRDSAWASLLALL